MNRSTPAFPPALLEDPIFYDNRNGSVARGEGQHLFPVNGTVLSVPFFEWNIVGGIMVLGFGAVGASRFCVDYQAQTLKLHLVKSVLSFNTSEVECSKPGCECQLVDLGSNRLF